jgi:hypothetical protein
VHLKRANRGDKHHGIGASLTSTLEIPELLETDIGAEPALGDVVLRQPGAQTVGNDGTLADRDVGETVRR